MRSICLVEPPEEGEETRRRAFLPTLLEIVLRCSRVETYYPSFLNNVAFLGAEFSATPSLKFRREIDPTATFFNTPESMVFFRVPGVVKFLCRFITFPSKWVWEMSLCRNAENLTVNIFLFASNTELLDSIWFKIKNIYLIPTDNIGILVHIIINQSAEINVTV